MQDTIYFIYFLNFLNNYIDIGPYFSQWTIIWQQARNFIMCNIFYNKLSFDSKQEILLYVIFFTINYHLAACKKLYIIFFTIKTIWQHVRVLQEIFFTINHHLPVCKNFYHKLPFGCMQECFTINYYLAVCKNFLHLVTIWLYARIF